MDRVIAIVGPTATGKSDLAVRLAQRFSGEIVNADSRQVYRYMDIGTAKPSREQLSLIPHHLIDIINPDEDFSLSQYKKLALESISDIRARGKLPFLVGGTGQYVWGMLEGWEIPHVPPDTEFRRSLDEKAAREGAKVLYQELVKIDPAAAQKIEPHNVRRIIRAIEVYHSTGTLFSDLKRKQMPPFVSTIIGLTADRAELFRRIDLRVDRMVEQGLVAEVEKLVQMDYGFDLPSMSGIGYRQMGMFLRGELTLEEAVQQTKFETHRIARHQYGWFRLSDARIKWFDIMGEVEMKVAAEVARFVA